MKAKLITKIKTVYNVMIKMYLFMIFPKINGFKNN